MLNFIYYPVSWIMWAWHWLFDKVLPDSPGGNGVAWALSVVFLVFTLRAILYKPFVKQVRTTKKMQEINPQLQAIRKKYAKDRVKMTEEMQKLQKEHGFNPMLGCLPMLLQVPVFIGLFHVLRSFNRTAHGVGQLGMTAKATRGVGNYAFNVDQVQNFLDARLFGVPLSSFITQPIDQWVAFVKTMNPADVDFSRGTIAMVVVPMMIIASIATHMNSRASVARQPEASLENPQTRMMNKLALYIFPLGILVTGPFFPVAILLYWVSNNVWTYGQQHVVFGAIAKEEEAAKRAKQEKQKANAPKPGARPDPARKLGKGTDIPGDDSTDDESTDDVSADRNGSTTGAAAASAKGLQRWLRPSRDSKSTGTPSNDRADTAKEAVSEDAEPTSVGSGNGAKGDENKAGSDKAGGDKTGGDKTGGDKTGKEKAADKAGVSAAGNAAGGSAARGAKQSPQQTKQKSGTAHVANKKRKGTSRRKKGGRPGGRR